MQFKREYKLLFGKPLVPIFQTDKHTFDKAVDLESNYKTAEKDGYLIKDHQIKFDIVKQATDKKGTSKITITNLSDDLANYLIQNKGSHLVTSLEAGYEDNLKQIFRGTITAVDDRFEGETRETILTLGDGVINIQECLSSRVYSRGSSIDSVVSDLITDLGLNKGLVEKTGKTYNAAKTFHGHTATLLRRVASDNGYRFSIQDGRAYFVRNGARVKQEVAKLTPETGLIGVPQHNTLNDKDTKAKKHKKKNVDTYQISCLLDGAIIPETAIYVESRTIKGWFKVLEVRYRGDYFGGSWQCDIEAQKVGDVV